MNTTMAKDAPLTPENVGKINYLVKAIEDALKPVIFEGNDFNLFLLPAAFMKVYHNLMSVVAARSKLTAIDIIQKDKASFATFLDQMEERVKRGDYECKCPDCMARN